MTIVKNNIVKYCSNRRLDLFSLDKVFNSILKKKSNDEIIEGIDLIDDSSERIELLIENTPFLIKDYISKSKKISSKDKEILACRLIYIMDDYRSALKVLFEDDNIELKKFIKENLDLISI